MFVHLCLCSSDSSLDFLGLVSDVVFPDYIFWFVLLIKQSGYIEDLVLLSLLNELRKMISEEATVVPLELVTKHSRELVS